MKLKRFLSGLLFGIGCALTFVGLLSVVFPASANPQMQLVIASFGESSDHAVIDAINRFMRFAFSQQWRLVLIGVLIGIVGAWLLILFSPRKAAASKTSPRPQTTVQPAQSIYEPQPEPEAPNPFAKGHYTAPAEQYVSERTAPILHAKPMLDPNIVEEATELTFDMPQDPQPYFSPRLKAESRAVQTEVGEISQSGSRILIRPVPLANERPQESPAAEQNNAALLPTPAPTSKPSPVSAEVCVHAPVSSRIRSTMGKHTSHNVKFAPPHS